MASFSSPPRPPMTVTGAPHGADRGQQCRPQQMARGRPCLVLGRASAARTRVPNSGPAVWGPAQFKVSAYGLPAVPAREAAGPAEKEPVRASVRPGRDRDGLLPTVMAPPSVDCDHLLRTHTSWICKRHCLFSLCRPCAWEPIPASSAALSWDTACDRSRQAPRRLYPGVSPPRSGSHPAPEWGGLKHITERQAAQGSG